MTTIIFHPERGGLGDGIIGCASAFILSQVLNAKFKINNGPIQFLKYFDIPENYVNLNTHYNLLFNYEPSIKHDNFFQNTDLSPFLNKTVLIKGGSNFYRFLYKNIFFKDKIKIDETDVIQYLFQNIIIPKKKYLEKLNYYITKYDLHNSVCIQLRMLRFKKTLPTGIDNQNPLHVNTIKRFIDCFKQNTENNKLILVTDNLLTKSIFESNGITDIVNIEGDITHSLKSHNQDFEKTLLDMLIIGECKHVIISYWSNFGRLGALRTKMKNIWLVEPDFLNMKGRDWKKICRGGMAPVIGYRKARWKEILSKEESFV